MRNRGFLFLALMIGLFAMGHAQAQSIEWTQLSIEPFNTSIGNPYELPPDVVLLPEQLNFWELESSQAFDWTASYQYSSDLAPDKKAHVELVVYRTDSPQVVYATRDGGDVDGNLGGSGTGSGMSPDRITTPRKNDIRELTVGLEFELQLFENGTRVATSDRIRVIQADNGTDVEVTGITVIANGRENDLTPGEYLLAVAPNTTFQARIRYRYRSVRATAELTLGTKSSKPESFYSTNRRVQVPLPVSPEWSEELESDPLPVQILEGYGMEVFLVIKDRSLRDLLAYSASFTFFAASSTTSVDLERLSITHQAGGEERITHLFTGNKKVLTAEPGTLLNFEFAYGYSHSSDDALSVGLKVEDSATGQELPGSPFIGADLPDEPKNAVNQISSTVSFGLPLPYTGLRLSLVLVTSDGGEVLAESGLVEVFSDIGISAVEPIQVTQDAAQSIDLVAGKATIVRVFFEGPPGNQVSATLEGIRDGQSLGTLNPLQRFRMAETSISPERNEADGAVSFLIPRNWTTTGTLNLIAEIDEDSLPENLEDDPVNNRLEKSVMFRSLPSFSIGYFNVCVRNLSETVCPAQSYVDDAPGLIKKLFPVEDGRFGYGPASLFHSSFTIPASCEAGPSRLCIALNQAVDAVQRNAVLARLMGATDDILVFWLPENAILGQGSGEESTGVNWELLNVFADKFPLAIGRNSLNQETFAQQIGRRLALVFPPSGENTIARVLAGPANDAVGFDTATLSLKPSTTPALMAGVVPGAWMSGFNYDLLLRLQLVEQEVASSEGSDKSPVSSPRLAEEPRTVAMLSGSFAANGSTAQLSSVLQVTSTAELELSEDGPYCVELRGSSTVKDCLSTDGIVDTDAPFMPFTVALSVPPDLNSIALTFNDVDIAVITPSANAPVVNIIAPQSGVTWEGGEQTISWSASDADGDALRFSVLGSLDSGTTWSPLATGLTDLSYTLSADQAPSSGDVLFRVLASDGFHTAEASAGPLTIATIPVLSVNPMVIDLGTAIAGDQIVGVVPITNSGTGVLTVSELAVDNHAFAIDPLTLPLEIGTGSTTDVSIRYMPQAVGQDVATLTITSDAGDPTLVTLQGTSVDTATPTIYVSTRSLGFAASLEGQTVTASVLLQNPSTANLNVLATVEGMGFSLLGSESFVLPANSQRNLEVAYLSGAAGISVGTLTIESDALNEPSILVSLTAETFTVGLRPTIRTVDGVVNGATFLPEIAAGSWVTIFGENFADGLLLWDQYIVNGVLPTRLGGVEVLINSQPAAIWFISPGQINVQAPADDTTGPVEVVVVVNGIASEPVMVELKPQSPGFFKFDPEGRKYLAAVHADGTFVGKEGLFGGAVATRPVKAGDSLLLFGTGFGATTPGTPSGVVPGAAPTANQVEITIGGVSATVQFAGIAGVGLYQFNMTVPEGIAPGDAEVIATINGVSSPTGACLTVVE